MNVNQHRIKVPWHFWLIGLFFVLIYAIGAYDYFMMLGLNETYYSYNNFGKEIYDYFTNYPMLPLIFWTTNIFSGIAAPILLLFRLRWCCTGIVYFRPFHNGSAINDVWIYG